MPRERPKEIAKRQKKKKKKEKKTKHYCLYGHAICAKRAKQRIKESKFRTGGLKERNAIRKRSGEVST